MRGVTPQRNRSVLDNIYYINDPNRILAQEVANPLVMEHLCTLSEDTGKTISELYQGEKWKADPHFHAAMVRHQGTDYYQMDIALLRGTRTLLQISNFFLKNRVVWVRGFCVRLARDIGIGNSTGELDIVLTDEDLECELARLEHPAYVGASDNQDRLGFASQFTLIGKALHL
jgi:hypothetical protein